MAQRFDSALMEEASVLKRRWNEVTVPLFSAVGEHSEPSRSLSGKRYSSQVRIATDYIIVIPLTMQNQRGIPVKLGLRPFNLLAISSSVRIREVFQSS